MDDHASMTRRALIARAEAATARYLRDRRRGVAETSHHEHGCVGGLLRGAAGRSLPRRGSLAAAVGTLLSCWGFETAPRHAPRVLIDR